MNNDTAQELISKVPESKQPIAASIIDELIFMDETLADLKDTIKQSGVVEQFKQGKQEFMRESPALKAYNTTIARYATLQKQLSDLLPVDGGGYIDELEEFNKCL